MAGPGLALLRSVLRSKGEATSVAPRLALTSGWLARVAVRRGKPGLGMVGQGRASYSNARVLLGDTNGLS